MKQLKFKLSLLLKKTICRRRLQSFSKLWVRSSTFMTMLR